jgi:hypothetical protein
MGRKARLGLFVLHGVFGMIIYNAGLQALRTGDASGITVFGRPVETTAEMGLVLVTGLLILTRGVLCLYVPFDECRPEEEGAADAPPSPDQRTPASARRVRGLRRLFILHPLRGCDPDEPWPAPWRW